MKYRPDIDGLRALAVLPVVFFHGGFSSFSGGFVGVDIFFVISGFLITSIILNDLEKDKFSIKNFYERRIRRIIPALYTVCLISLVLATLLFLPNELENFGKSLVGTIGFVSNILFWSETGYFDASSELKPLLHTWSLAVEEQFYVFFPLCLLLIHRYLNKKLFFVLSAILVMSFVLSVWGAYHKPSATFYWAPTRAWELLIGSILALGVLPKPQNKFISNIGATLGLALIAYAVICFDYDTVFPGFNALYPCLGTALLIYFNQNEGSYVGKILSWKLFVFVGLCSYSFYLWHWPVFVFANYLSPEHLDKVTSASLILLSFVLSVLTWKYIETPFRNRKFLSGQWRIFIITALASVLLLLASIGIVAFKGVPERFSDMKNLEEYKGELVSKSCMDVVPNEFENKKCLFGDTTKTNTSFIVWGDSHAGAMVRGIARAAKENKKLGYLAGFNGCIPLLQVLGAREDEPEKCNKASDKILSLVKSGDTVFLVGRWTYYTRKSLISKEGPTWINDEHSGEISEAENYQVFERALRKTVKAIKEKGANPVIVDTVPEFPKSVPESYYRFGEDVAVSKGLVELNKKKTTGIMKRIADKDTVSYVDPLPVFCDSEKCYGTKDGRVYFFDNDHINLNGALKLSSLFSSFFK